MLPLKIYGQGDPGNSLAHVGSLDTAANVWQFVGKGLLATALVWTEGEDGGCCDEPHGKRWLQHCHSTRTGGSPGY